MAHKRRGKLGLGTAAAALLLTGCATPSPAWMRADGQPIYPQQFALDRAACTGEVQKTNLAAGRNTVYNPDVFGYTGPLLAVFNGCMADRGYLPRRDE